MDCVFALTSSSDSALKRWVCVRSGCGRSHKGTADKPPRVNCLALEDRDTERQHHIVDICAHRGRVIGRLDRVSCSYPEQPLYECGLYREPVTLRRHRKHPGRNCLDCKLDAEEVADQLGKQ